MTSTCSLSLEQLTNQFFVHAVSIFYHIFDVQDANDDDVFESTAEDSDRDIHQSEEKSFFEQRTASNFFAFSDDEDDDDDDFFFFFFDFALRFFDFAFRFFFSGTARSGGNLTSLDLHVRFFMRSTFFANSSSFVKRRMILRDILLET